MVESLYGAADFIIAVRRHTGIEIARGQFAQARGEPMDRSADARGEVDQKGERHQPDAGGEHDIRALHAQAQIPRVGGIDGGAGLMYFAREAVHGDITEAGGVIGDLQGGKDYLKSGNIVGGNLKLFEAMIATLAPHLTPALKEK